MWKSCLVTKSQIDFDLPGSLARFRILRRGHFLELQGISFTKIEIHIDGAFVDDLGQKSLVACAH